MTALVWYRNFWDVLALVVIAIILLGTEFGNK